MARSDEIPANEHLVTIPHYFEITLYFVTTTQILLALA